ncbi:PREDICTED: uncharacterized protein LOC109486668 isoform X4 [Branchiostoma belcheri]|uniref:Uncharacterized protein LOC109486668 isoform X4 n=1 Tax=Branchiostoma belcheri TaxID=7741 RepID=A0A6P5AVZ5_BRABE|nr:PREDICTED: uncharacterized protein LOC109486668 isoform X4 [Branchiostoma belcheri]
MDEKEKELIAVAGRGDEDRVKQLLAEGVNVNAANNNKWSALHHASEHGHTGTVQALLTAGARVNARTVKGNSALHSASMNGYTGTVQALLTAGATVDARTVNKWTALYYAANYGHAETVQALLTAGARVDARTSMNETPLHHAAKRGHPKCVSVLLRAGANTVIRNNDKKTAEELAVQEDVQQVFQVFKALQPEVVNGLLTINLYSRGLTSVPAEVFEVRDVECLILADNRLKSIPEEIGQLQKLQRLELNNNLLTQLPQAITTLPNLQNIDLSHNKLETLPDGFSRLKLQHLNIQNNVFEEIPEEVCSLLQLRYLGLGGNPLKGLPDKISQLIELLRLDINDCQFDEFPRQVLQLEGLETLLMGNWAGKGKPSLVPEDIGRLKNLKDLRMENSGLESLPDGVGELSELLELDIAGNIFKSVPEQVMNLSNIRELNLSRNRISRLPLNLGRMTQIMNMYIGDNPLTYPPPDVCEKGTAVIMDSLRRELKKREDKELRKLFSRFSQNVTETHEVEDLAGALGLSTDEASKTQTPRSQANKVLLKWMETDSEASMDKLQQELSDFGMDQLAQEAGRVKAQPVKRQLADTSGGPPAKHPAAGGSSGEGHREEQQTKEKIRHLAEQAMLTQQQTKEISRQAEQAMLTQQTKEMIRQLQAKQKLVQMQHHSETQEAMSTLTKNLPEEQKLRGQVGFPRASVPTEVEMGGPEMMALYEQACKDGTTDYYHIRLILTGKHGNGKSSLQNSLLQLEFNRNEESTDGIVITPCLMTGKEQWKMTKGMKDHQFAHAVGTEMKKIQEKKKKEPKVPKRTKEEKKTTRAPEVKPDQATSTDQADEPLDKKPPREHSARTQEMAERTTSLSEDYALATQFARGKDDLSSIVGSKEQPAMSIWDFAGHDVYYSSHHVFYSHYAIFILTLNLTKALSDPLEPWSGSCAEALQLRTEADVADYHLEAIRAHTRPNKSAGDLEENQGRGPPVIVVGTHKDQVNKGEIEDFFTKFRDHLRGKAIGKDVYDRYFAIDNTKRDLEDRELSDLRDAIFKVAQEQNHMGRRIPISWLELKSKLMEMEKQGRKYCSLQDVIAATDHSRVPEGFTPEENTVIILRFFHLCGDILFFNTPELRNFVILDPQWFVDVQKTIITIPKFRGLKVKHKWEQLEATGVLEDSLIMDVWKKKQEELKCDLIAHKDELLKMMEQFDLVLQCSPDEAAASSSSSESTTYFVPSLLTTVKERERLYPSGTKCSKPIFVVFDEKFFPVGVYHRLVIASMRRYNKRKPLAYARCARFITSNLKQTFIITKKDHYLKVELLSSEKEGCACFSHGPDIRKGLDEDLREIINKWIPGIRYKWCLQCCCANHKDKELDASSFIPITSVTEWFMDGEVACETFAPATTTIQDIGLAQWFRNLHAGQSSRTMQQETTASVATDVLSVAEFFPAVVDMKPPWEDLGRKLGLSDDDIEQIRQRQQDHTSSSSSHCLAVLEKWLHLSGTNASVDGLKRALVTAGQGSIAEKINTMKRMMSKQLLELQSQVTSIVRANFPNLDFVQAASRDADKERVQLNRKTLREELFSSSFNYSLSSFVYDVIQDRKRSVCRIDWAGGSLGTGFLLSKRKILTCFHVYKDMDAASGRFTDLSLFTATFFVSPTEEYKVRFPSTTLKCSSDESGLDYAILSLAVDDEIAGIIDSLPYLGCYISDSVDQRNMVVLVGHPFGGSKLVDFCPIAGLDQRHIIHVKFGNPEFPLEDPRKPTYHTGIMFHGSSGSPGFDTYGNVALMHTRGFFPDRGRQSIIERGVLLSAIRDDARQKLAPEVFSEIF